MHKLHCVIVSIGGGGNVGKGSSPGTKLTCRAMPSPALLQIQRTHPVFYIIKSNWILLAPSELLLHVSSTPEKPNSLLYPMTHFS